MTRRTQHYGSKHVFCLIGAYAMMAFWTVTASAQTVDASSVLYFWLQQPQLQVNEYTLKTSELRSFYAANGFRPLWVDNRGLTRNGAKVLEVLANAGQHGLNSERYQVSTIQGLNAMAGSDDSIVMQKTMSTELLMSAAVMRYAADMQGGSVAPQWQTGREPVDAAARAVMVKQVAEARDPAAVFESLAPNSKAYTALKTSLQHYQQLAAQGGWPHMAEGAKIAPGQHEARIAIVRQILIAQGDLPQATYTADMYDAATVEGVKNFQGRHGIEPDGVIGKGTQTALNVPVTSKVQQIAMTMERMRWMPHDLGQRYVLVNIPAYKLTAVSGSNQLAMNVIVGKPDTKTPMFSKEITNVVLNPTWSVPAKIAVKEMLPKIRKNPGYLARAGFSVIGSDGKEVASDSVDWESNNFAYTLRQDAGDGNALGKVKFTIPDSDNIYLHDTSSRGLFVRSERSLSHGCVRLADPRAMTEFVLNNEGWDKKKIDAAYDGDASRTVKIAPLPVHLVYWTAWVDESGRTHFGRDIYAKDKPLLMAMNGGAKAPAVKLAMNQ